VKARWQKGHHADWSSACYPFCRLVISVSLPASLLRYPTQELRKPARPLLQAGRTGEGGGSGGNGWRQLAAPGRGGRPSPAVAVVVAVAVLTRPTLEQLQQPRSGLDAAVCSCGDRREPECSCAGQRRRPIPPTEGSGVLPATGGSHV
jgi:hypothetical protein